MASKAQLINGAFQDLSGNPLNNGILRLTLSHDSNLSATPYGQVVAGVTTTIYLDNNGNVSGTQYVWTNDVLSPSGSYYTVDAYNNQGLKAWGAPQYWTLTYSSTIDLGQIPDTNP
jgi:hypothetical protein